jgi:hypothetical protein
MFAPALLLPWHLKATLDSQPIEASSMLNFPVGLLA